MLIEAVRQLQEKPRLKKLLKYSGGIAALGYGLHLLGKNKSRQEFSPTLPAETAVDILYSGIRRTMDVRPEANTLSTTINRPLDRFLAVDMIKPGPTSSYISIIRSELWRRVPGSVNELDASLTVYESGPGFYDVAVSREDSPVALSCLNSLQKRFVIDMLGNTNAVLTEVTQKDELDIQPYVF